jgi:hypothetical protein
MRDMQMEGPLKSLLAKSILREVWKCEQICEA